MHHLRVAIHAAILADCNAAELAYFAEIVAFEINQHCVFGSLFVVASEIRLKGIVSLGCAAPWPGSGDRFGQKPVALPFQKQFRTGTDEIEPAPAVGAPS